MSTVLRNLAFNAPREELADLMEKMNAAVEHYKRGLEFYAAESTWVSPSTGWALQYDPRPSPADTDKGQIARSILADKPAQL